jgi:hypothetical protein
MVEHCKDGAKRVRHSSTSRSGGRTKTRTWYTVEHYQDCEKVKRGTETYTRVVQRARWCVELDNVGGDPAEDDVWYEVDSAAYGTATDAGKGAKVSFVPLRTGC